MNFEVESCIGRKCPKCQARYIERPATSRKDGKTLICPDCGMREALESIGIGKEEIEKIVEIAKENSYKFD